MDRKRESVFAWYVVVSWARGVLTFRRFVPKRNGLPLVRRVYCCVRKIQRNERKMQTVKKPQEKTNLL